MSEYIKPCIFCEVPIRMSDKKDGKWLPYNLDGTIHDCKSKNQTTTTTATTATKKVETNSKPLSLEDLDARLKRLEAFLVKVGLQK